MLLILQKPTLALNFSEVRGRVWAWDTIPNDFKGLEARLLCGKDFIWVTAEYLRSPSASDSWHDRNGYVGAKKAIEAFIHSFDNGQVARITHNV
jgi:hypothetical protein